MILLVVGVLIAQSALTQSELPPLPFAEAALWAAELPTLRLCDQGIDGKPEGCPVRPEHGGAGFLSAIFTWRYALNNLRVALASATSGSLPVPQGADDAAVQILAALDIMMQNPLVENLREITQTARGLFDNLKPWLQAQPVFAVTLGQRRTPAPMRWNWPSSGGVSLGDPSTSFTLWTGARMPAVGFGTWRLWTKEAYQPTLWALQAGYRHLDTAEGYANEAEIGRAIKDSGVPRSEIFLATKASSVPKGLNPFEVAEDVFASQLVQLGTDYVDMYMLHTVPQDAQLFQAIWQVMESLYDRGRAKALGLSNCDINDLRLLYSFARIRPAYIQNLFKVYKPGEQMSLDVDLVSVAQQEQIAVVGYSVQTEWPHILPPLSDPHVLALAAAYRRTASQVLHRWALQRGVGIIPKSASKARIIENGQLFDFELDEDAMRVLDGLVTLSESGAGPGVKPPYQDDVFGLFPQGPGFQQNAGVALNAASGPEDEDLLSKTQNLGFSFATIQQRLLGPGQPLRPTACRAACHADPRCSAWEVCAPLNPRAGCEGCYLIGAGPQLNFMKIEGWHAAVERIAEP